MLIEQKIIGFQLVRLGVLFLCAALLVTVNGCGFFELEKEVAEIEKTFSISGRVIGQDSESIPLVVVLYRSNDGAMGSINI